MRISGWMCVLQQALGCFAMLWAMALAMGLPGRSMARMTAASVLGGAGAVSALMLGHPAVRVTALMLLAAVCPRIAFPHLSRQGWLRLTAAGITLSLILAATLRFASGVGLPDMMTFLPSVLLLPLTAAVYARQSRVSCALLEIRLRDRRTCVTAMVDSGNLLRDPLTGLPVIVCSRQAMARLTLLPPEGQLCPGMRFISVRTASGSMLMPVLRPTMLRLRQGGHWQELDGLIGLAAPGYTGWQALMPESVLRPGCQRPAPRSTIQGG